VKPGPFKYAKAQSLEEVTALLDEHGDEAKILAGGQSLIPLMNMRLARPGVLVDINQVPSLDTIEKNGTLTIGATARQAHVLGSPEVKAYAPVIPAALRHVGHVGIRTRGTFGGSAAHADPASEIPAVLLALDAEFAIRGPDGDRSIPADEFFVSTFETALEENEVLTGVSLPYPVDEAAWSFHEVARRHGDFALVGVVAIAEIGDDGTISRARIALSGVSDTPVRARAAEDAVIGQTPAEAAEEAGRLAERDIDPPSDFHASREYRLEVSRALVRRAFNDMATQGAHR
jgi:carbon-monoxide dehydrogenase medium subunit